MTTLLLEIGAEEIPAGFVPPALEALQKLASEGLAKNRVAFERVQVYGTPRRLVLCVTGVAESQPDAVEELLGPSASVAFDAEGKPTKAAEGFARSRGATVADLLRLSTDKGDYVAVRRTMVGRPTAEVLAALLPEWIAKIPFRKSMRWGAEETAFVRPIHWIVALLGGEVIPFSYADVKSGRQSAGHRFHAPAAFEVMDADDYFRKVEEAHVVLDPAKRREAIRAQVEGAAAHVGGRVLADDELLDTITYLVEQPTAVAGSFEPSYLELPQELLILTMKTHQKYFAVAGADGKLMNHFVTVSNTRARDMSVVARGNERVLRARLSDAKFFFVEDQKATLEEHAEGLKKVVFQSKLGTSYEKVERFRRLAGALAARLCPAGAAKADRIARLCKADLTTSMVYEFPELQGVMGREYALRAGEDPAVARGIQEHYWPTQAGGALPSFAEADCVSMADKLDTIVGCFGVGLIPTGTADPYALRRQTIGVLRILLEKGYRLGLGGLIDEALGGLSAKLTRPAGEVKADVADFFRGRFEVLLTGQGYAADAVAAVLAAGFDDVVEAKARLDALEAVRKRGDLATLAATFKRAANILKGQEAGAVDESLLVEAVERDLWRVYGEVADAMADAVKRGDYLAFFAEAAKLKVVVDAFFEGVMVLAEDPAARANRVALMGAVTALFGRVADFTRFVG